MRFYYLLTALPLMFSCGKKTAETTVSRGNIAETVFASGTLEPRNKYNLTAQSEGYITALHADHGEVVKAGQLIASIENVANEAAAGSAEVLYTIAASNASENGPALQQALHTAALMAEKRQQDSINEARYRTLFAQQSATRLQLENAQLAFRSSVTSHVNAVLAYEAALRLSRQQLAQQQAQRDASRAARSYNSVAAPVAGKIYRRLKEAGDFVRRGEIIAVIGHETRLYARLTVDENSIARVRPGQEVVITLNTAKEKNFKAVIARLLPAFDEQSQSFICEAEFRTRPEPQIAGTQLQANIITGKKSGALLIPRSYLSYGNQVNVKGKGAVTVKTGFVSSDYAEVTGGLAEGEIIVTEAP